MPNTIIHTINCQPNHPPPHIPTIVYQYRRPAPINYSCRNNLMQGRGGFGGKRRGRKLDDRRGKCGRNKEQGSSTSNIVPNIPAPVIIPQDPIITLAINKPACSEINNSLNEFEHWSHYIGKQIVVLFALFVLFDLILTKPLPFRPFQDIKSWTWIIQCK